MVIQPSYTGLVREYYIVDIVVDHINIFSWEDGHEFLFMKQNIEILLSADDHTF